ncbi:MAG TPA: thioredoxin [Gammaproteobacteria bacterium]|nr:thioredoxin [Gammaproteobacteria bacterium]
MSVSLGREGFIPVTIFISSGRIQCGVVRLDRIGKSMSYLPYLLGVLAVLVVGFQLYPLLLAFRMRGRMAPAYDDVIDAGQEEQSRLLFYFWSPACGMCRSMTPIIDELIAQRKDVVKVDVSETPDVARRFRVLGTPGLAVVEKGKVEKVMLGVKSRQKILELLPA